MDSLKDFTNIVYKKQNLTEKQVVACIDHLTSENIDVQDKEDFLFLAKKGESTEEIASFINYFRILSKDPELNEFETMQLIYVELVETKLEVLTFPLLLLLS